MTPALYRQALEQTGGSPHQMAAREVALERFFSHGLPTPRDEDWKYTPLDFLQRAELHAPHHTADDWASEDYPGTVLKFGNGRLMDVYTQSIHAHSLADRADTALVVRYLGQLADTFPGNTALAEINSALWQDGVLLHVPAGWKSAPLFMVHRTSEADAMLHLRHLVVLEAGAEAVLVEHNLGAPGLAYWHNSVTEIVLGEGAQLTHLKLDENSAAATHTGLTLVQQARDSRYRALSLNVGARVARHDTRVHLDEAGATCQLDGVFIATGRRHIDQHLHVEHRAPHTGSKQTWRGIADGRGRGIFDARVVVQPGARKADAQQSSRNLLLSPHAEIDVKPQLEIYTDDVKCGHGATVGQLDPAEIFYLRSRGIDADTARALLLRGFVEQALGLLKNSGLADWLEPHLAAALPAPNKEHTA
ncbi:MAG: Fe-S cluster assembly protein SufD [Thiobacillus sp.]|nr:Fe-S cluster assembly protein SufD [Thiobacillus sp.]